MKKIDFLEKEKIGSVENIDSGKVIIELNPISDNDDVYPAKIGELIAISSPNNLKYVIVNIVNINRDYITDDTDESIDSFLASNSVTQITANYIGTLTTRDGSDVNKFKRGIDDYPRLGVNAYYFSSENLSYLMNSMTQANDEDIPLCLGKYALDGKSSANLNGNRFFQKHAAILGSTGSGKSWLVAKLLEESNKLKYSNILVFDIHGEYHTLAKKEGAFAQYFKIAGPSDTKLDNNLLFIPYWLLNRSELQSIVLDRNDKDAPNQANRFNEHILLRKKETLKKTADDFPITGDSPIPFKIDDLIADLKKDDNEKIEGSNSKLKNGPWNGKLTRFIARLESKTNDKRNAFMFCPPTETLEYEWIESFYESLISTNETNSGIKIIDFSEVPSDILPIITAVLGRLIMDLQSWIKADKRTPIAIICDEAHLYLPTRELMSGDETNSVKEFERIAKEGRKYGVSLIIVSQRPADLNRTIISQCNNFIVLRLTNGTDQNTIHNLLPDSMNHSLDQISILDVGEAVIIGDSILMPSKIILDKPEHEPDSKTKPFWNNWNTIPFDVSMLKKSIKNMRAQTTIND